MIGLLDMTPGIHKVLSNTTGLAGLVQIKDCLAEEVPQLVLGHCQNQGIKSLGLTGEEITIKLKFVSIEEGLTQYIAHLIHDKEGN